MKLKDLQNLRTKAVSELEKIVFEKKKEAALTHAKIKAGQEKNISKVKRIRRDIAQILTVIREREIMEKEQGSKSKIAQKLP